MRRLGHRPRPRSGQRRRRARRRGHAGGSRGSARSRTPGSYLARDARVRRSLRRPARTTRTMSCAARRAKTRREYAHRTEHSNSASRIRGAREHNLKNISPRHPARPARRHHRPERLGEIDARLRSRSLPKASGASSTAMSPYARQFVEQMEKPDVDLITGVPPTVAIEQRITRGGGKIDRGDRHGGLSFPAPALREARHAVSARSATCRWRSRASAPWRRRSRRSRRKALVHILAPLIKARKGFHTEVAELRGGRASRRCSWMASSATRRASRSWSASRNTPSTSWSRARRRGMTRDRAATADREGAQDRQGHAEAAAAGQIASTC